MQRHTTQGRAAKRTARPHLELQALRINEGLSPNDLAYRAGVSGNTIRLAESGFTPTPRVQFAIARVFGLAPLDLWPIDTQIRVGR